MEDLAKEYMKVRNRAERRRFWKMMSRLRAKHSWSPQSYPPTLLPINLGVKQYKRDHPGETNRIAYYKKEMWKAHAELRP